jgi:tripartite-type tricarboxylate transporter receptor subunit TctC
MIFANRARLRAVYGAALIAAAALTSPLAAAQDYPGKPVRLIVGFPD